MSAVDAPPFPTAEGDNSGHPEELRHIIAALRAHAAWQARTLAATTQAHDRLAARASAEADEASLAVAARHEGHEQNEVLDLLRSQLARVCDERDQALALAAREADTVRDLRLRLADSRRAFIQLQHEGEHVRRAIADRRRSQHVALGLASNPVSSPPQAPPEESPEEARAKRASKRASLAFGPNGSINLAAARNFGRTGHTRTASSTTSATPSTAAVSRADRKLRGLSLLGAPPPVSLSALSTSARSTSSTPTVSATSPVTTLTSRGSPVPSTSEDTSASASAATPIGLGITSSAPDGASERAHHRRNSSVSASSGFCPSVPARSPEGSTASSHASPRLVQASLSATADAEEAADVARRRSRMLVGGTGGDGVPANLSHLATERLQVQLASRGAELERLRTELSRVRDELDEVKEARWASDVCLKALKEYIALLPPEQAASALRPASATFEPEAPAALQTGARRLHLPPLPVDATAALEPGDEAQDVAPNPRRSGHQSTESWSSKLGSMWRRATTGPEDEHGSPGTPTLPTPSARHGGASVVPTQRSRSGSSARSLGANFGSIALMASGRGKSPPATVPEDDEKAGEPDTSASPHLPPILPPRSSTRSRDGSRHEEADVTVTLATHHETVEREDEAHGAPLVAQEV